MICDFKRQNNPAEGRKKEREEEEKAKAKAKVTEEPSKGKFFEMLKESIKQK